MPTASVESLDHTTGMAFRLSSSPRDEAQALPRDPCCALKTENGLIAMSGCNRLQTRVHLHFDPVATVLLGHPTGEGKKI
jgi:hypothetical protein